MLTKLKIVDNSGASLGRVIKILNKKKKLDIGNLILVSILKNIPHSKIRKGDIHKAIIVTGNNFNQKMDKSIVLVKESGKGNDYTPIGSRVKIPISSILKNKIGMQKIIHLSKRSI